MNEPRSGRAWDIIRAEARAMARSFFVPLGITMLVFGALFVVLVIIGHGGGGEDEVGLGTAIPMGFALGLFYGFWAGVIVGGLRLAWFLAGPWIAFPILVIPSAVALSLWAFSGILSGQVDGLFDALVEAGAEREWLIAQLGPAARIGPPILIVALPLLAVDLLGVLFDPHAIGALVTLLFTFAFAVLLAAVPTGLMSLAVLLVAYVRRVKRRHASATNVPEPSRAGDMHGLLGSRR